MRRGMAASAAAWVNVSKDAPRKLVLPPYPFQRAIGRMNSRPAVSAICASFSISLHFARQRFDTLVKAVPPSALMENSPSLKPLAFDIGLLACIGVLRLRLGLQHAGRARRTK